ncbi:MAG: ParB N-terminal domain-containing protein [Lachnospiraceae bacterium]|nr:ParB N-terminal domain-containing protein [Lachnospiraceae bacterium]
MSWSSDFLERVRNDIKTYKDRREMVRVNILVRLMVHKLPPEMLKPNPDDEFTFDNIGPNERIIQGYCEVIRRNQRYDEDIFPEPIIIQRMQIGGYMILNGHHRWAAALHEKIPMVRVTVVNPRKKGDK